MAKKILVVDDDPSIVEMLESRLKRRGYSIITALDGKKCIEEAKEKKPDLILLDVNMPELDGFAVCKYLKEDNKTKDIPIIMLTALAKEKDLAKGLEEGVYSFISKPFNFGDLLSEIETAINRKS